MILVRIREEMSENKKKSVGICGRESERIYNGRRRN